MNKEVKEVFKNCVSDRNLFNQATVDEVKFSKKLNAAILISSSELNIPMADIEEFERCAKRQYELDSFKINYTYKGKNTDMQIENVYDILSNINKI